MINQINKESIICILKTIKVEVKNNKYNINLNYG